MLIREEVLHEIDRSVVREERTIVVAHEEC